MKKIMMDTMDTNSKTGAGSRATELLAETEAIFEALEKLRDEYRSLHELQTRSGYATMVEHWRALSKDAHAVIRRVGDLIEPSRDCCRAIDFWYPNQERPFLADFNEDVEPLYPQEVDGFEPLLPFVEQVHALLKKAAAATATGEPGQSTPAGGVAKPVENESRAPGAQSQGNGSSSSCSEDPAPLTPRLLSVEQAAAHLGRTEEAMRHLIAEGTLPVVRCGRRIHMDIEDLNGWITEHKSA